MFDLIPQPLPAPKGCGDFFTQKIEMVAGNSLPNEKDFSAWVIAIAALHKHPPLIFKLIFLKTGHPFFEQFHKHEYLFTRSGNLFFQVRVLVFYAAGRE